MQGEELWGEALDICFQEYWQGRTMEEDSEDFEVV